MRIQKFNEHRVVNLNCIDCKGKTEAYFVKDSIWDVVPKYKKKGQMCLKCLEKRLGRKLTKSDFMTGGTGDIHPSQPWWESIKEE